MFTKFYSNIATTLVTTRLTTGLYYYILFLNFELWTLSFHSYLMLHLNEQKKKYSEKTDMKKRLSSLPSSTNTFIPSLISSHLLLFINYICSDWCLDPLTASKHSSSLYCACARWCCDWCGSNPREACLSARGQAASNPTGFNLYIFA